MHSNMFGSVAHFSKKITNQTYRHKQFEKFNNPCTLSTAFAFMQPPLDFLVAKAATDTDVLSPHCVFQAHVHIYSIYSVCTTVQHKPLGKIISNIPTARWSSVEQTRRTRDQEKEPKKIPQHSARTLASVILLRADFVLAQRHECI